MLFLCVSLSCSASAGDSKLNDSKYNGLSDPSIEEFANDSSFIAYRGILPETVDQAWENSIANCWLNLTLMGPSYSELDNSINSVATNNKIIIIELSPAYKEEMNDSRINKIYQNITNYCEQQEGISDIPVVFMWAQVKEDLSLSDYGPESFEEAKKLFPGFITARGTMPEIHQEEEKSEWVDLLTEYSRSSSRPAGINPYLTTFGGPVNSFGADIHGYLIVGFDESTAEKVNDSVIDEIYQVIDEHFKKKGISDVPVVFTFIRITDDLAPANESDVDDETVAIKDKDGNYIDVSKNETDINKDGNLTIKDNKTKQKTNGTTNQTSGFTSIMVILGILLLSVINRL